MAEGIMKQLDSCEYMHYRSKKQQFKTLAYFFEIEIFRAYKKPFHQNAEEGSYIANHMGELKKIRIVAPATYRENKNHNNSRRSRPVTGGWRTNKSKQETREDNRRGEKLARSTIFTESAPRLIQSISRNVHGMYVVQFFAFKKSLVTPIQSRSRNVRGMYVRHTMSYNIWVSEFCLGNGKKSPQKNK